MLVSPVPEASGVSTGGERVACWAQHELRLHTLLVHQQPVVALCGALLAGLGCPDCSCRTWPAGSTAAAGDMRSLLPSLTLWQGCFCDAAACQTLKRLPAAAALQEVHHGCWSAADSCFVGSWQLPPTPELPKLQTRHPVMIAKHHTSRRIAQTLQQEGVESCR